MNRLKVILVPIIALFCINCSSESNEMRENTAYREVGVAAASLIANEFSEGKSIHVLKSSTDLELILSQYTIITPEVLDVLDIHNFSSTVDFSNQQVVFVFLGARYATETIELEFVQSTMNFTEISYSISSHCVGCIRNDVGAQPAMLLVVDSKKPIYFIEVAEIIN